MAIRPTAGIKNGMTEEHREWLKSMVALANLALSYGGTYLRRFSDRRVNGFTTKFYYVQNIEAWTKAAAELNLPAPVKVGRGVTSLRLSKKAV
jgi:hypothetical protein